MLRGDVRAVKKSSSIVKLDPILVNGILRVGGRLHHSSISSEARHPAILPKHHYISNLIAQHYHRISGHSGLEHTLSLLSSKDTGLFKQESPCVALFPRASAAEGGRLLLENKKCPVCLKTE